MTLFDLFGVCKQKLRYNLLPSFIFAQYLWKKMEISNASVAKFAGSVLSVEKPLSFFQLIKRDSLLWLCRKVNSSTIFSWHQFTGGNLSYTSWLLKSTAANLTLFRDSPKQYQIKCGGTVQSASALVKN